MDVIVFQVSTAALLILMLRCGVLLLGEDSLRRRGIPWAAVGLTLVGLVGVAVQSIWKGAFAVLADDPSKQGWWRPATAVFLQNNAVGAVWNLVTLAAIATLAQWAWGPVAMLALFAAGALLPSHLDPLFGIHDRSLDPRNFVGSSGATYFLAATMAGAVLVSFVLRRRADEPAAARGWRGATQGAALAAVLVPVAGLAMWFAQANGHGLVSAEGFVLGVILAAPRVLRAVPVAASTR